MTTTPETTIVFRRSGGHSHDGLTSSLIDTTKYSFFDFSPMLNGTANTARRRFQDNNRVLIKKFIVDTIEERVLNPQGIEIKANVITARNIAASTITANELSSNLVLVNNIIRSNSFDGTFHPNSAIATTGTVGWAIANSGAAVFNDVTIRGNITGGSSININNGVFTVNSSGTVGASSGTIGGWSLSTTSISAGSTALYSNGHIVVASGTFNGAIAANSGNVGGWNIESTRLYAGSTSLYSNGYLSVTNGSFNGHITAGSGNVGNYSIVSGSLSASSSGSAGLFQTWSSNITLNTSSKIITNTYYVDNFIGYGFHNVISFNDVDVPEGGIKVERGTYDTSFTTLYSYAGYRYGALGPQNLSDERLKNIIDKNIKASDIINQINVKSFTYKTDMNNEEKLGFIAQQLYEVIPNAVIPGGEDPKTRPWTVVLETLIPYLTKSNQELIAEINDIKTRLETLEGV